MLSPLPLWLFCSSPNFFHFAKEGGFPHKWHFSSHVFYFPLYLTSSSPPPTPTHCLQEGRSVNLACFQHGLLLVVGSLWKLSNKMNQMLLLKSVLLLQQLSPNTKGMEEWELIHWNRHFVSCLGDHTQAGELSYQKSARISKPKCCVIEPQAGNQQLHPRHAFLPVKFDHPLVHQWFFDLEWQGIPVLEGCSWVHAIVFHKVQNSTDTKKQKLHFPL